MPRRSPQQPLKQPSQKSQPNSPHRPSEIPAPRWEQRYRAPSQREPLPREHHEPHELAARRAARWNVPDNTPDNGPDNGADEADEKVSGESVQGAAPVLPVAQRQWSAAELEDLAHETMAHRGRKLSRRRARVLAARARRRHVNARRTEPKKKRPPVWRLFRAIAFCLFIAACVELGAAALTSPRFAVQEITSDSVEVTPDEAIEQAKAPLRGQNFFRAHRAAAAQKLAALPAVKRVSVVHQLEWPPRLHINLEERQPFARVDDGQEWWVVDQDGVPFRRAGAADDKLYAVSSKALRPKLGAKLKADNWASVVEFAQALAQDKQQGHNWALRAIYFDEHGFASLRLAESRDSPDRTLVHLGTGPWQKKLERTRQALKWLEIKGVQAETLNLISANRPVWTPRRRETEKNSASAQATASEHPA